MWGDKEVIMKELENEPIVFKDFVTLPKVQDKWLGEIFHMDGLGTSVNATIEERAGRIKASARSPRRSHRRSHGRFRFMGGICPSSLDV